MIDINTRLMTRKADLGDTLRDATPPPAALAEGEVILALDRFSLTTNNITYAAFGDSIGYWKVFPTDRDDYGLMPVWGFADVTLSTAPGIEVGARVFGFFPIADTLRIQAGNITRGGFVDQSPWRKAVPDIYSRYVLCAADAHYAPELESSEAIFRPLFITSYTAVDFLRDNAFFGARQIVVSSASSKTAYGAAHCLAQDGLPLLAVTGQRNRAFVESLGCYSTVVGYDQLETLPTDVPTLYLDLTGDPELRARVHGLFGDNLVYDCLVGGTRTDDFTIDPDLAGPKPTFFFAATRLDQHREQGTSRAFYERFAHDQRAFFERVVDSASPWITIVEGQGMDAAARVIRDLADGTSDPAEGHIVRVTR